MDRKQWTMDNVQRTVDNGQYGQWTVENGQVTKDNELWALDNGNG